MDEYLKPNSSFLRLYNEYKQYGSLVIAYDFDNTVYDFHKKGETYENVIQLLKDLKQAGCYMVCFTANSDSTFIYEYLYARDIPIDSLNENPPFFKSDER